MIVLGKDQICVDGYLKLIYHIKGIIILKLLQQNLNIIIVVVVIIIIFILINTLVFFIFLISQK